MPQQSDVGSHCVVQWEDSKEQYAIVDLRRSKVVSALKVGITTLFEGYNRFSCETSKMIFNKNCCYI